MSSINKKKSLMIACYTIFLTFIIGLCFTFFISQSNANIESIPQVLYYDNLNTQIISRASVTSQQLHDYFRQAFFQYLPLLIITICFFILLFSGILLYGIRLLDKRHDLEIANELKQVADAEINLIKEPILKKEYQLINQKISAFEEDQKRLHSYIAHEQKNLIMLLKGRTNKAANPYIAKDIDKLSKSVDDILTLSAHNDSQKTICDLAMIAAEQCDSYQNVYPKLSFNFDEDSDYTILGKEQWLRRAIDNLIENAIKYGNQKPINVYLKQKYNSVLLYVQDHGYGINEEEQEKIFDYGYRMLALKKDGYGIGLSLVRHVCNLCDGFINIKSEPGQGSLFILAFPLV
ncbi:sensor histidine kinase [Thomasclavelia sp.]